MPSFIPSVPFLISYPLFPSSFLSLPLPLTFSSLISCRFVFISLSFPLPSFVSNFPQQFFLSCPFLPPPHVMVRTHLFLDVHGLTHSRDRRTSETGTRSSFVCLLAGSSRLCCVGLVIYMFVCQPRALPRCLCCHLADICVCF